MFQSCGEARFICLGLEEAEVDLLEVCIKPMDRIESGRLFPITKYQEPDDAGLQ